ncbi:MAG: MBL fold metallo-hydrolase [bacterium]|nr:MBL fold metallo-hydrolase [bacterium]
MKITKLGHCCLKIEERGLVALTDPGNFSTTQNDVTGINLILITHEHADHCHIESLKKVLANNPEAKVVTNSSVGVILAKEGIPFRVIENGQKFYHDGVGVESFGDVHAEIHSTFPRLQNTGYFIENKLFYPGDALTDPGKPVPILALPVSAPWLKISEAIDYAIKLKPVKCFPVHDGMLAITGGFHKAPAQILPSMGIEFTVLELDKEMEF